MIFVTDAVGSCVYVGQEWTALSGQSAAECLGHGWIERVHKDDRSIVRSTLEAAASTASEFSVRYRLLQPNGQPCWVAAGCVPSIGFPQASFLGYLGSLVKLTAAGTAEMAAYGNVGRFVPPPVHSVSAPQGHLDQIADYLLLAHALIETDGAKAALPGLRMALYEIGRALAVRKSSTPTLN